MTTHELEQLLLQQPISLLHRLARGRISRHFRSGKRKLIDLLVHASTENRPGLESDLMALIEEQARRQPPAPAEKRPQAQVNRDRWHSPRQSIPTRPKITATMSHPSRFMTGCQASACRRRNRLCRMDGR